MRIRFFYLFLFLFISEVVCSDQIILGTDIQMEIASFFQWNQFYNMYYSIDGSKTMEVIYERKPINCCVEQYKNKLFIEEVDVIENEWYEGECKYFIISHYKGREKLKKCILFIGDQKETYLFYSKINLDFDPNAYETIINVYKSSKKTNAKKDVSAAFFFQVEIPTAFVLLRSQGNHFIFEKQEPASETKMLISFRGLYYERDISIDNFLLAQIEESEILIESNQYASSTEKLKIWKVLSNSEKNKTIYCRYALLMLNKLLYITADYSGQEVQAMLDEVEKIVRSIRY